MEGKIKKVGLVVMGNISVGGGYPKVAYDLSSVLKKIGKEVYILTPFELDYNEINNLYGPIKLERVYNPGRIKKIFCITDSVRRRLMKKEFQKMAKEVDFIIDLSGGVFDRYLPKGFKRENYVIWGISLPPCRDWSWISVKNLKRNIKEIIKNIFISKRDLPAKDIKIYPVDEWTFNAIVEKCGLNPEKEFLYPLIKVEDLLYKGRKKRNQITILGRIDPFKRIEDSIQIFFQGTKKYPNYDLVIIGGTTPESKEYIKHLEKIISDLGIKSKIRIIKNPPFNEIKTELLNSKIVIDSQSATNLTITSIEAMAAGNIVLVNRNGGTFTGVLENGKYGYGFRNIEEGAKILENLLERLKNNQINVKEYIKRAKFFSEENFTSKLRKILNN